MLYTAQFSNNRTFKFYKNDNDSHWTRQEFDLGMTEMWTDPVKSLTSTKPIQLVALDMARLMKTTVTNVKEGDIMSSI